MTSSRQQLQALIDALLTNGALTEVQRSIIFSHAEVQNIPLSEAERMIEAAVQASNSAPEFSADQSGFLTTPNPVIENPVSEEGSTFISSNPSSAAPNSSTTSQTPTNSSGTQFGAGTGFTDVEILNQESFTLVQKARLDGRWVIVKRIKPEYRMLEGSKERFFQEYFASRTLEHPHIVDMYGRGEDDEGVFFYREYIDGQSIAQRLQVETILGTRLIHKIAVEILDALQYAHRKNVYHGSLTSDEVQITTRGNNVKILSFGRVQDGAETLVADKRTDIQAFGLLLLELFTGSNDLKKIINMPDDFWKTIVQRCLATEARDRFTDAAEILAFIQKHTSNASVPTENKPPVSTPPSPSKQTQPLPPLQNGSQRLPSEVLILVLGILSIMTCCGMIFGIIGWMLAAQSERIYAQNPGLYSSGSLKTVQAGKICSIIGLVLGILGWCFYVFLDILK